MWLGEHPLEAKYERIKEDSKKNSADDSIQPSPAKIDLTRAQETSPAGAPQTSGEVMSGLQQAGFLLAKFVLSIIAASLLALSIVVAGSEFYSPSIINKAYSQILDQTAKAVQLPADNPNVAKIRQELRDLAQQIVEAKQAQRAFWIQFSQMMLLNLLLPVLTAILGYVFGASRNQ